MSGLVKKVHRIGAPSIYQEPKLISDLHKNLNDLSQKEKIAIHLRYWRSKTILEISKQLGISWDSTDKLIEKAQSKLRKQLIRR